MDGSWNSPEAESCPCLCLPRVSYPNKGVTPCSGARSQTGHLGFCFIFKTKMGDYLYVRNWWLTVTEPPSSVLRDDSCPHFLILKSSDIGHKTAMILSWSRKKASTQWTPGMRWFLYLAICLEIGWISLINIDQSVWHHPHLPRSVPGCHFCFSRPTVWRQTA